MNRRGAFPVLPIAAALTATLLSGCNQQTVVEDAAENGPAAETAILGEPVTLQAEVEEIVGPNAFTVGDDATLIISKGMAKDLTVGDEVQVTGTVREFVMAEIEDEYEISFAGEVSEFIIEYEDELAVVASKIQELPE